MEKRRAGGLPGLVGLSSLARARSVCVRVSPSLGLSLRAGQG